MNEVILHPSAADVDAACEQFDRENGGVEEGLRELFGTFPENARLGQVLIKVTAVNALYSTQIPLYSTRIPTIIELADHIVHLNIDPEIRQGSPEAVRRIASIEVAGKAGRYYYSFASKYCSWHNPASYPINDSRVRLYLSHLRHHKCLKPFREAVLWEYPRFKGIVEEFQTENHLESYTFKKMDKFMYFQGTALLMGREERRIDEDGTIVVPVPGQPGEMEWSVENYSSPEEAELSRRKFTEPTVWVEGAAEGHDSVGGRK